jgi:hypothetical protein
MSTTVARRELELRKSIRSGWLLVVASLLIPPFGLGAAYTGLALGHTEARRVGLVIATLGMTSFIVRLVLWLHWTG